MNIEDDLGSGDLWQDTRKHQEVRHVVDVDNIVPPQHVEQTDEAENPCEEDAVFKGIPGCRRPLPAHAKATYMNEPVITTLANPFVGDSENVNRVAALRQRL